MNNELTFPEGGGTRSCMPLVSLNRVSVFVDRQSDPESNSEADFTFQRQRRRRRIQEIAAQSEAGEETREKVRARGRSFREDFI